MGLSISKHRRRRSRSGGSVSPGVDPDELRAKLTPLSLSRSLSPTARYQGLDAHPIILQRILQHADANTLASMMRVSHSAREAAGAELAAEGRSRATAMG